MTEAITEAAAPARPLHVAFLTTEYPPLPSGGIGTSIRTLARALVRAGHRVTVVGWGTAAAFDDEGVRVRFLGHTRVPRFGWLLHRLRARRCLAELARRDGLDVVEAHDWTGPSAGIRLPVPLVVRCNGTETYFAHLEGRRPARRVRWAEGSALRGASAVAAASRFTGETTRRLFALREEPVVIPNGVDLERFPALPYDESEPGTLLALGSVVRKKGALELPAILAAVRRRVPTARLRVVGRDVPDRATGAPSTRALLEAALRPEDRGAVDFVGPLAPDAVASELRRAAVCLFPSRAEALPVAWLEAMATARPLVAWRIGWAEEVVGAGAGELVEPGDVEASGVEAFAAAVAGLLRDHDRAAAVGKAARERVVERFAADRVAAATADWYRDLLAGRR